MNFMKDYYKILDVSKIATDEEIKKAFRNKAIKFHPDKNKDPKARKNFFEANEAYRVIGDPFIREMYDYVLKHSNATPITSKHETDDKISSYSNAIKNAATKGRQRAIEDSKSTLSHYVDEGLFELIGQILFEGLGALLSHLP